MLLLCNKGSVILNPHSDLHVLYSDNSLDLCASKLIGEQVIGGLLEYKQSTGVPHLVLGTTVARRVVKGNKFVYLGTLSVGTGSSTLDFFSPALQTRFRPPDKSILL